jgi:DNA-binding transcriptional ArsR family regulator
MECRWKLVHDISACAETCLRRSNYDCQMNTKYSLASTAALIADPARAAMLAALLDGRSLPSGELARIGEVSAQSASMHLSQLVDGGLLVVKQQGRHRYYTIARREVAHAVEALGVISTSEKSRPIMSDQVLRYARTCYDHLAGELAVQLMDRFEGGGLLIPSGERDYEITRLGEMFFSKWAIDVETLRLSRRHFARRCLDWTERRDHLAGSLGAAICEKFLAAGWIRRDRRSRAVHVSLEGRRELSCALGCALQ